jgi:hypothetical protein
MLSIVLVLAKDAGNMGDAPHWYRLAENNGHNLATGGIHRVNVARR